MERGNCSSSEEGFSCCLLCRSKDNEMVANCSCEVGLRLMLRYLDIDMSAVTQGLPELEGKEAAQVFEIVGDSLCEDCSSLVDTFSEVYQDFEKARLLMAECVQMVTDQLKHLGAHRREKRMRGDGKKLGDQVAKKCHAKINLTPRVALTDVGSNEGVLNREEVEAIDLEEEEEIEVSEIMPVVIKGETWSTVGSTATSVEEDEPLHITNVIGASEPALEHHVLSEVETTGGHRNELSFQNHSQLPAIPETISCIFCPYISTNRRHHHYHVLCSHPIEFYAGSIPPGTSLDQLNTSINGFIEREADYQGYKCRLCGIYARENFEIRVHILEIHTKTLIASLVGRSISRRVAATYEYSESEPEVVSKKPEKQVAITKTATKKPERKSKRVVSKSTKEVENKIVPKPILSQRGSRRVCFYCDKVSTKPTHNISHMMVRHTHQFFGDQIPPGASPQDIDIAVTNLLGEGVLQRYKKQWFHCKPCGSLQRIQTRKLHVLKKHFNLVAARLDIILGSKPHNLRARRQVPKQRMHDSTESVTSASAEKRTGKRKGKKVKRTTPCPYCRAGFVSSHAHRLHQMCMHTYEHFAKELPDGTCRDDLEQAVAAALQEDKVVGTGVRNRYHCYICDGVRYANSKKLHILRQHFDLVKSKLVSAPTSVTPMVRKTARKSTATQKPPRYISESTVGTYTRPRSPGRQEGVKCQVCHKVFTSTRTLKMHSQVHKGFVATNRRTTSLSCIYCNHKLSQRTSLVRHKMCLHTLQHFAIRLPSSTTEEVLEQAIQQVINDVRLKRAGLSNNYECQLCSCVVVSPSKRIHVLTTHFDKIISAVKAFPK